MKASQLEHIVTATQALQVALADAPSLAALKIEDCLKAAADRAVFRGRLGGDAVVVKLSHGPRAATDCTAQAAELRHHAPRLSDGPYRVPGLVAALPRRGLLVMTFVPGMRLIDAMKKRHGGDRRQLAAQAGRWLAYLTAERKRRERLAAGYWHGRIKAAANDCTNPDDRALLGALAGWMMTQLAQLDETVVTQVRGHGDFCPLNLIVDGDVIYGVDLQNTRWFALERDLARFLVVSAIGHGSSPRDRFGIDDDEMRALLSVPGLIAPDEAERLMPFFLATEMGGRLVSEAHKPSAQVKLRRMIDGFLGDAR